MQPKLSQNVSTYPAMEVVLGLDKPSDATDVEPTLLNHGDDVLDVAIGLREMVRNAFLFGCMRVPRGAWTGDAIAVGSGPSLDAALPHLKELQKTVLIVAAHSAVPRLLAADIVPHVIAPKERDPSCGLTPSALPPSVIYAGLPCVPDVPQLCQHHWFVTTCDHLLQWLGFAEQTSGSVSSGTLAARITAQVANNVYLVGHDMTMGHYAGFNMPEETETGSILCADGERRPSCLAYRRACKELGELAQDYVVVQTNLTGARITGRLAVDGRLPEPGNQLVILPTMDAWGRTKPELVEQFKQKICSIGPIMAIAEERLQIATTAEDISARALFGDDELLGASLFQSVYLSMSIMKRTQGLTQDETVEATKIAIGNAMNGLRGAWKEMAHGFNG